MHCPPTDLLEGPDHEAHLSAEQSSSAQEAWFPPAHAYPRRPFHPVLPPQQGPRSSDGVTRAAPRPTTAPAVTGALDDPPRGEGPQRFDRPAPCAGRRWPARGGRRRPCGRSGRPTSPPAAPGASCVGPVVVAGTVRIDGGPGAARGRGLCTSAQRSAYRDGPPMKYVHMIVRLPSLAVIGLIRLYQRFISPLTGPSCKFHPTCSAYAIRSLQIHGLLKGTALSVARLGRCHPWQLGGINPPPPAGKWRANVDLDGNPRGV